MPRRLTRAQIEAEGGGAEIEAAPVAEPRKMTAAQIAEAGGGEAIAAPPAPGKIPDSLTEQGGLSHGPGTSFALNALDSLSMVGVPTVLGGLDAVRGIDSADKESKGKFSLDSLSTTMDRYRKNKGFYEGGMKRLADNNKKSALAGQFAPMVVPGGALMKGAKLLPTMARGAVTGAATGALRGSAATADGDIEGTLKDAAIGGAAGAVLSGAGAVAGKAVEAGGNLARKGMTKVLAEVKKRTNSDIGTAKNLAGQAAGAVENAWNANAMKNAAGPRGVVPGLAHRDPAQVARNLGRREGNVDRALDVEAALFKKHGQKLREPIKVLNAKHTAELGKEATGHLKGAVQAAGMWYAGYKGAEAVGVDPRIGAAIGGAGGIYAIRKISQAATSHPETLKKLMALKPIGQWLARQGAKGASVPKNIAAIVYAMRDKPEVKRVLEEYDAATKAPTSIYKRAYPEGRPGY